MRHETSISPAPLNLAQVFGSELPSVPPQELRLLNALAQARPQWTVDIAGKRTEVSWAIVPPDAQTQSHSIRIATDAGTITVRFGPEVIEAVFADDVNFEGCDPELIELLAKHALIGRIAVDETELNVSLAPQPKDAATESQEVSRSLPVGFDIRIPGKEISHSISVSMEIGVLQHLQAAKNETAKQGRRLSLALTASIRSQDFLISDHDLRELAQDDLLQIEGFAPSGLARWLCVGGTCRAMLEPAGECWCVGPRTSDERNKEMPKETEKMRSNETLVPLTIEFGRKKLTLDDAASLTEGSIIDFGPVSFDEVTLRSGEQAVARGMIVEVGTGVGLKILSVY